ncbi:MAG: 4Fe-4S dicluster domain-containing protein [Thermodesulfobacteriota bacterium]
MSKALVIDISRCTGCGYCEIICSFAHHDEFNPLKSRIKVSVFLDKAMAVPVVCYQCEDPWCVKVCPSGALTIQRDPSGEARIIAVDKERCVGCRMCTLACPFGCIVVNEGQAEKCNLCGGDPECVKVCRAGALKFADPHQAAMDKKKIVAERLLGSHQEA